jgi:hypothetical protein
MTIPLLPARALAVGLACMAAACNKPTAIALEPSTPIVLTSDSSVPLPRVVGLRDGAPVEKPPEGVKWSVEPSEIAMIEIGGNLAPMKNGTAKLRAVAGDLPPAEVEVRVEVIDELKVQCPAGCDIRVGETLGLTAQATGLGAPLEVEGVTWESSDPTRASVEGGKVTALTPGNVIITARLGKKSAEAALLVRANVDELRLTCPWPPVVLSQKKGGASTTTERTCDVHEGEEVTLVATFLAQGSPVEGELVDWKSSDPSARVVFGSVAGEKVGAAMIEAKGAGLQVEMPVSVLKPRSKRDQDQCPVSDAAFKLAMEMEVKLESGGGETVELPVAIRCEDNAAKKCFNEGLPALTAAAKEAPLDAKGLEAFARLVLDEKARRCCCKR